MDADAIKDLDVNAKNDALPFRELILLVDDNVALLEGIKLRLEMSGYQVLLARDGLAAWQLLQIVAPQVIVSDVMMPGVDGWTLFANVRADPRLAAIPFIFLTARSDDASIQRGKALGVEDYIVKPFKAEELMASIRGRLRRVRELERANAPAFERITAGDFVIDSAARRVFVRDREISLTPTEFNLLIYLAKNAGRVCEMEELARAAFPGQEEAFDAHDTLRVHVKNLRKKIEAEGATGFAIVNVRGIGYRLDV